MTMTNGDRDTRDIARDTLSDADLRMLAETDWLESGGTLTGKELAERYGKSPRWGQDRAAAARKQTADRGKPVVAAAPRPRQTAPPTAAKPAVPRRKPAADLALRRVTAAAVTLVALVAAAASYSHMHALALEAGEGTMAVVLPLSVDGLVVAATMTLLSARRTNRRAGPLPWLALLLGLGASLAANVAAAEPTVVGRLVAAWPPVALALSVEMLLRQTRGDR
jgi:hypothetical protein